MLLIRSINATEKNYKLMSHSFALDKYSDMISDIKLASIQNLILNACKEEINRKAVNKALKNQKLMLIS